MQTCVPRPVSWAMVHVHIRTSILAFILFSARADSIVAILISTICMYVLEDAYRREFGFFYIFVAVWDQLEKECVVWSCNNPPIFGHFSPSGRSASREHCNRYLVARIDKIVIFCPHPIWHSVSNGHTKRTALRHFHSVPPQMWSKWWTSSSPSLHISLKANK